MAMYGLARRACRAILRENIERNTTTGADRTHSMYGIYRNNKMTRLSASCKITSNTPSPQSIRMELDFSHFAIDSSATVLPPSTQIE